MSQCDFTHNLAAGGTINWPEGRKTGFVFNGAEHRSAGHWKQNVAGNANWKHNLAVSARRSHE
jgi:hypothetical protein